MTVPEERRALSVVDHYWKFIVLASGITISLLKSSWTLNQLEDEIKSRDARIGTIASERKSDHDDLMVAKADIDWLKQQNGILEAELWKIGGGQDVQKMRATNVDSR
jgi:hypothetical protein